MASSVEYFSNARNFTIHGGNFTSNRQLGIDKLVTMVSPNAMHNSSTRYDPPRCHEGTRMAILERIMQWVFGSDDRDALILWIYGPAGAGKSAILQSIAEKCAALNILLASFFFSRFDGTRNHANSLVATIAYEISTRIPQITAALDTAIVRDPMIFERTLDAQIVALIVEPLRDLVWSGFFADPISAPRLILIDGLDECNNKDQRADVLHAVARAIRSHGLPLIFLISSRPETDITVSFNSAEIIGLWNVVLDDDYLHSRGIRLFLHSSFQSIKDTHPLRGYIPQLWPGESVFDTLVRKSSGQYIYPSTVIKYISNISASPVKQLDVILGLRLARSGHSPFAELDALYMHILSSVPAEEKQLMLDVLAILMGYFMEHYRHTSSEISRFLLVDQEEIDLIIMSLASITKINKSRIQITHASLEDFLSNPERSGNFYIDKDHYTERLACQGIRQILHHYAGVDRPKNMPSIINDSDSIIREIFNGYNSLKMSKMLYQNLQSLPLSLMWHDWDANKTCFRRFWLYPNWVYHICHGLSSEGKFQTGDASSDQIGTWCKELLIKYAECLKPLITAKAKSEGIDMRLLRLFEIMVSPFSVLPMYKYTIQH